MMMMIRLRDREFLCKKMIMKMKMLKAKVMFPSRLWKWLNER